MQEVKKEKKKECTLWDRLAFLFVFMFIGKIIAEIHMWVIKNL